MAGECRPLTCECTRCCSLSLQPRPCQHVVLVLVGCSSGILVSLLWALRECENFGQLVWLVVWVLALCSLVL